MLEFSATIDESRQEGPPHEAEVLAMNPGRRERILQTTGWQNLFPGSLNLKVTEDSVHRLLLCTAVICERGEDILYHPQYAKLMKLRVGYLYFRGRIKKGNVVSWVLIRRACNPLPTRVEAFSELKLREALEVSDGDTVVCEVDE
ncbi:MAG: hypothetical protein ACREJN_04900 [Nitrospiraceae bacterium]